MSSWVYPVVAHSLWSSNGFLSPYVQNPVLGVGCIDFAGSAGIHMVGGLAAFVSAYIVGPRRGRFYDSNGDLLRTPRDIPGHSVSLQVMGVLMLWFGCKFRRA
jgi:ammonium transporter, Amt family